MKPKKKFLMIGSNQVDDDLRVVKYEAVDNPRLWYDKECSFPMLPLLHGYVEEGDVIEIVDLHTDNDKCRRNFEIFKHDAEALCSDIGVSSLTITPISVIEDNRAAAVASYIGMLVNSIEDGDRVYACLSYGTKPMMLALYMALSYAYRVKPTISIERIVYGTAHGGSGERGKGQIFDETSLIHLDGIFDMMAQTNVQDPGPILRDAFSSSPEFFELGDDAEGE